MTHRHFFSLNLIFLVIPFVSPSILIAENMQNFAEKENDSNKTVTASKDGKTINISYSISNPKLTSINKSDVFEISLPGFAKTIDEVLPGLVANSDCFEIPMGFSMNLTIDNCEYQDITGDIYIQDK